MGCDSLLAMRRFQSGLLIFALLAVPIALPARTGPCAQSNCDRICALVLHSVRAEQHPSCVCGMNRSGERCSKQSPQIPDYGLNAPMAPTMLSAHATIARPDATRGATERAAYFVLSDFVSEFFEPPRA